MIYLLDLSIKTSVFSTPPTSVQRRCAPFGVVYAPGYRVGNVTHILADVGYLNHFINLNHYKCLFLNPPKMFRGDTLW